MIYETYAALLRLRDQTISHALHQSKAAPIDVLRGLTSDLAAYDRQVANVKNELRASNDLLDRIYVRRYLDRCTVTNISVLLNMSEATVYRHLRHIDQRAAGM